MASPPRLLAFAGSLRQESFNRRLIRTLVEAVAAASALRALRTR